jgi:large subunit ribosomal protein L13
MLPLENMQKALAGLRRINLDGLRWRVFDAKGQVGVLSHVLAVIKNSSEKFIW